METEAAGALIPVEDEEQRPAWRSRRDAPQRLCLSCSFVSKRWRRRGKTKRETQKRRGEGGFKRREEESGDERERAMVLSGEGTARSSGDGAFGAGRRDGSWMDISAQLVTQSRWRRWHSPHRSRHCLRPSRHPGSRGIKSHTRRGGQKQIDDGRV